MTESPKLLAQLSDKPLDDRLRARAARALEAEGKVRDGYQLLIDTLTNLTAHEAGPLPCLCKRCIKPSENTCEAKGLSFYREFAIAQGRVLFFWVPDDLPRSASLPESVAGHMDAKFQNQRRRRRYG